MRPRILMCLALALVGCDRGDPDPSSKPHAVAVTLTPASVSVLVAAAVRFTAAVSGAEDASVAFSVVEGPAGGSISTTGAYLAPTKPGTYHVRATSNADPSRSAEAEVRVRGYERVLVRTADPSDGYHRHTANELADGTVLLIGGRGFSAIHSVAERYLPGTNQFQAGGTMGSPRLAHTATVLPDGTVLVAGGTDGVQVFTSTELYDPAAGQFAQGPSMSFPHREHRATLMKDGRVLITGGIQLLGTGFGATPNTELYDAGQKRITSGTRMNTGRWLHTATLLADGRVLIVGGRDNNCSANCPIYSLQSAELFDPATGNFTVTGSLETSRWGHSAARLPDGRVLILGGEHVNDQGDFSTLTGGEIYDPATGRFTAFGNMRLGRSLFTLTLLNDGKYLVAGGKEPSDLPSVTTEIFDAQAGTSIAGPDMADLRQHHTATRLMTGEVLLVGGFNSGSAVLPVELFR